jgi:hypothetical protein
MDIITIITAGTAGVFLPLYLSKAQWFLANSESDEEKEAREKRELAWRMGYELARQKAEKAGTEFVYRVPRPEERSPLQRIPDIWFHLLLLVGAVGLLVTVTQSPLLFTAAGRADLAERGLLMFVIAFAIAFKGYMIAFGAYKFFQRLYQIWLRLSQNLDNDELIATPPFTDTLGSAGSIITKTED